MSLITVFKVARRVILGLTPSESVTRRKGKHHYLRGRDSKEGAVYTAVVESVTRRGGKYYFSRPGSEERAVYTAAVESVTRCGGKYYFSRPGQ